MASRPLGACNGRTRGRRASVAEVIRHATINSGLTRIFTRRKSVHYFEPSEREHMKKSGDSKVLQDPNSAENQGFPLLIISPPTTQPPPRDINIELGALGIIFPQPPSTNGERWPPTPSPGADSISAWVNFFSQSEYKRRHDNSAAEPESVIGTAESTDGMATPLGVATSSMTLMDHEGRSRKSTPREVDDEPVIGTLEHDQDLRFIGDEVVLKYILDGTDPFKDPYGPLDAKEGPNESPDCNENVPKVESYPASETRFIVPSFDQALPELRYRKDPTYEEPPVISLITATPNGTIGKGQRYVGISAGGSDPITLLATHNNHQSHSYHHSDIRGSFTDFRAAPNTNAIGGSYDSVFLDSEFAATRHSSMSVLLSAQWTVVHVPERPVSELVHSGNPAENATGSTTFTSLIRKIGGGIHSIFRFRRAVTREEMTPGKDLGRKGIQVQCGPEMSSAPNEGQLYSLQSALDISVPVGRNG